MLSVHIPFMQIKQLQLSVINVVLSEFQLMIRMEGMGGGGGRGGEEG